MKFRRNLLFSIVLVHLMVGVIYGGTLTNVTATPDDATAGASTIYTITFTTAASGGNIPTDGKILITFPSGFDVSGVSVASSNDANLTGGFSSITPSGQTITLIRDGTGNVVGAGITVSIDIANVTNITTTGSSFTVAVETQDNLSTTIDSGTSSTFSITAGPISKIVIEDAAGGGGSEVGSIPTTTDNDSQQFFAIGRDEFDNFVSNASVSWEVTGGIGSVSPTSGTSTTLTLTSTGSGVVTADDGSGHTDVTGTITVSFGVLDHIIVVEGASGDGSPMG
ncbi:MAG: hypothetical protein ACE5IW_05695, partial [bacterium]